MRWSTELIHGMGKRGDQFIIVLNIAKVFSAEGISLMKLPGLKL